MEHAKKYIIMDPRFARPTMLDKALSALDGDIENFLNKDAPDDVKAKRYLATVNRYRSYSEPPPPTPLPVLDQLEPEVLQSVPKNVKYKAKQLLKRLKKQKMCTGQTMVN
jgi:hypothetical protein